MWKEITENRSLVFSLTKKTVELWLLNYISWLSRKRFVLMIICTRILTYLPGFSKVLPAFIIGKLIVWTSWFKNNHQVKCFHSLYTGTAKVSLIQIDLNSRNCTQDFPKVTIWFSKIFWNFFLTTTFCMLLLSKTYSHNERF